jgi:hypothetical protein
MAGNPGMKVGTQQARLGHTHQLTDLTDVLPGGPTHALMYKNGEWQGITPSPPAGSIVVYKTTTPIALTFGAAPVQVSWEGLYSSANDTDMTFSSGGVVVARDGLYIATAQAGFAPGTGTSHFEHDFSVNTVAMVNGKTLVTDINGNTAFANAMALIPCVAGDVIGSYVACYQINGSVTSIYLTVAGPISGMPVL